MKNILVIILSMFAVSGQAADSIRVDLRRHWLELKDNKLVPHSGNGRVLHVSLNEIKGGVMAITSQDNFNVFIGNRLRGQNIKRFQIELQDVKQQNLISVYSSSGLSRIRTEHIYVGEDDVWQSRLSTVSSTAIIIAIVLLTWLILLMRTNGAASAEYFNVIKLFSTKGVEDNAFTLRITSASNLLYYTFCSALVAFNLFVLNGGDSISLMTPGNILYQILGLLGLAIGVIAFKIVWVNVSANIFGLADFAPTQFYNYIRMLLISFVFCSLSLVGLIMMNADWSEWLSILSYFIVVMGFLFIGITFFKLVARGGFTVFHLFSYLCASEIVPFIILLNIYFS